MMGLFICTKHLAAAKKVQNGKYNLLTKGSPAVSV